MNASKMQPLSTNDGSPVGSVRPIRGRGRRIWIGGRTGLAFFDEGRVRRVVSADIAAFGSVSGIEESSDGSLWLCERRGVIHIPSTELRKTFDSPSYRGHLERFDLL